MKLYTEKQVKKVIKDSFLEGIERNTNYESVKKSIFNSLIPIELPSDEEIEKEMIKWGLGDIGQIMGYRLGFKDCRKKIQGGNNEQQ